MPVDRRRKIFWLVVITFSVLLAVTFVIYTLANRGVESVALAQFKDRIATQEAEIRSALNFYSDALYSAKGFYEVSPPENYSEYSAYFSRLVQLNRYPGIVAMAFLPRVKRGELSSFIDDMRRQGYPKYNVSPLDGRAEYYPIKYTVPLTGNESALGMDLFALADRRSAIEKARDTGEMAATSKVRIFASGRNRLGFVIFVPVYKFGMPTDTVDQRRNAIVGVLDAAIVAEDLFGKFFINNQQIALEVFDGTDTTEANLYYDSDEAEHPLGTYKPRFVLDKQFRIADRDLILRFYTLPDFRLSLFAELAPGAMLIMGVLLSLLISYIIYILSFSRERAILMVKERTRELNEEKDRIARAKAKDEATLESIGEGVVVTDKDGIVLLLNTSAQQLIGYSSQEMIGERWADKYPVIIDDSGNKVAKDDIILNKALRLRKKVTGSYFYVTKDGKSVAVTVTASPLMFEGELTGAVVVVRDTTREKEIDKAKTEFISIASHQLRTPVSGLNWLTEALRFNSDNLTPKQKKYVDDLSVLSKRLIVLVEDLLNLSRIQLKTSLIMEKSQVNISDFIREFVNEIEHYAKSKEHSIVLHDGIEGQITLEINKKSLYNVLQNLVSNAIEYSPVNTAVTVSLEKIGPEGLSQEGGLIKVSISNKGPLIPKSEQSNLFGRFYRAESSKKVKPEGTGLGLYIVKTIIEGMGGNVGFVSEEGKDIAFWFTIPIKAINPQLKLNDK